MIWNSGLTCIYANAERLLVLTGFIGMNDRVTFLKFIKYAAVFLIASNKLSKISCYISTTSVR